MMFDRGYLTVGRWGGAPVRVHWTLPIDAEEKKREPRH